MVKTLSSCYNLLPTIGYFFLMIYLFTHSLRDNIYTTFPFHNDFHLFFLLFCTFLFFCTRYLLPLISLSDKRYVYAKMSKVPIHLKMPFFFFFVLRTGSLIFFRGTL